MRGEQPTSMCLYDEEGGEVRELILEAFRQYLAWELEREAEERPCP